MPTVSTNKLLFFGYPLAPENHGASEYLKNRLCAIREVYWTVSLFAAPLFNWDVRNRYPHHIGTKDRIKYRQSNLTYLLKS